MKHTFLILVLGIFISGCGPDGASLKHPPVPVEPPAMSHVVKYSGETLAAIAQWYTGDTKNWKQIANFNPSIQPNKIRIGDTIRIPTAIVRNQKPFPKPVVRPSKPKPEPVTPAEATPTSGDEASTASPESDEVSPSVTPADAPTENAPTEEGAAAPAAGAADLSTGDSPVVESTPSADEADLEQLRRKTRQDLLNDVLNSEGQ